MLHRHFREIRYRGQFQDRGKAILLIANHFTWWDGFIQGVLNQNRFQRNFYVMMLEEQLRKFPILRTTGAFSIRKHSRSMLESLVITSYSIHYTKLYETIYDLQDIEHAYAPPYSSAKDPVNQAGFAAENIIAGRVKIINWSDLQQSDRNNFV